MPPSYWQAAIQKQLDADPVLARAVAAQQVAPAHAPSFRGAGQIAQTTTAPAWLLSGPAETGKTFAGLWRLDTEARRWPNSKWVLGRKVRATMDSTVLNTWRRLIAVRGGVTVFGGEKPQWYDYPNGARVFVFGFDNPDNILSGEYDGAYINQAEELGDDDFEKLTTRVTGRGAVTDTPMVWGDCNPGPADHWIIRARDTGTLALLESKHEDNPTLYDESGQITAQGERSMAILDALTGVRYLRLRKGLWVGAEGQYFDQLDESIHLKPAPARALWRHWWLSLDYGWNHPFSCGLLCATEADDIWCVDVHHERKWTVQQHADAIDAMLARHGVRREGLRIVAGHDCWASRGGDDPETIADKFKARGYILERAVTDRINGARAVGERLGNPAAHVPPSLFFDPRARQVFDTLTRMVHSPRNSEDVLKVDADASGRGGDDDYDMLRYGVMVRPVARGADLIGFV